jgi:DNA ligase (NAD+)
MTESGERIAKLRSILLKAKQAYYIGDAPIMSDEEYDALEDELRALDPGDPVLAKVGVPVPGWMENKARHRIPMGSQSKVNTEEEFAVWYAKSEDGRIHASLKGDGASAAGYYEEGKLEQVISRGDGVEGEDITANALRFKGLPSYVAREDGSAFTGAVRFEVILTVEDWAVIDPEMSKNPRNLGNGIMGRKDGVHTSLLSAFAFDVVDEHTELATESSKTSHLEALGFRTVPNRLCADIDACVAYYREVAEQRAELPFWIDGVVMKIDDLALQRHLGVTAGRPKGQVAWKFASEGAETFVRGYTLSGGHTGVIVPTAHLDPVEIGGTTVRNALLNNWEEIERLDVAVGDRVWLIKANDIIPKVIEVRERAPDGRREAIPEPTECPFCGSRTGRRLTSSGDAGAATVCLNGDCPMKSSGKIKRWIKGLDILGIGDSLRDALIEQYDLADPSGLYLLRDDPARLAGVVLNREKDLHLGEKRATGVLAEIEKTRELTLVRFLGSLGIEGLGQRRAELVIKGACGRLDRLEDWRAGHLRDEEFAAQCGLPTTGERIQDSVDAMGEVIDNLLAAGVVVVPADSSADPSASESRTTVCITGKLPSGKKKGDYAKPLEDAGYQLVDKVAKDLDILVLADPASTSSKAVKARKLGIRLMSEAELEELIAQGA